MENQFNRANRPDAGRRAENDGLVSHLKAILEVFRNSSRRGVLIWFGVGLALVVGATVYGQIRLNAWSRPFYDALSHKDLSGFASQLFVFVVIAGALLVLNVAQTWLNQMTELTLREELTRDLFAQWLSPGRAFLLAGAGDVGINPDQRIHEDARHLAELSTNLSVGLFQATLLLTSFIAVLWFLSAGVVFEFEGAHFVISGYMVWCALFYSGVASWAGWRVGRPLVQLNAERYARESNLRFALVHANEHSEGIAVHRGEAEEKTRLQHALDSLVVVLRGLVSSKTRLTWVTAGYGWFTIIAPIVVAAPAYFMGNLSFGGMLMAVGAFDQVQQSLRWFVDNVGVIADWRATLFRVGGLRCALIEMDRLGDQATRIELGWSGEDKLCFEDLGVISPTGYTTLNESRVEIMPKDHVLILGAPASGKTSLFRAMAGLWSWGKGKITLPPAERIMFMPKRPYIPDGALRDVLAYPALSQSFTTRELEAVLANMGLSYLSCWLDREARWDKELSEPDQQGLAFARVLLHKPGWVIVDEAIGSLREEARIKLFDIFENELATTAVIYISGSQTRDKFFTRVLRLTKQPRGRVRRPMRGLFFSEPTNENSSAATLPLHIERASMMKTAAQNRDRKKSLLSDAALLDLVQRQTFLYFWDGAHKASGLARDRVGVGVVAEGESDLVAIGGSGFGVMATIVATERGWVAREEAIARLSSMLDLLERAPCYHGHFPHFMNGRTGAAIPFGRKDDGGDLVETSYLFQGLLCARQYFDGDAAEEKRLRDRITRLWLDVDWNWHVREASNVLTWHWSPNNGFSLAHEIRGWNECLVSYVLASASPSRPVDPLAYHQGWAQSRSFLNGHSYYHIDLPLGPPYGGPLYFSQYSFCGLDPRGLADDYADYWLQNTRHVMINYEHCVRNPGKHKGYGPACWGITSSDGPASYYAHAPDDDKGVIAPTAALSSFPYAPEAAFRALRHFYDVLGDKIWGRFGFADAFSEDAEWVAGDYLAIDQGPIVIMIENYRTGLLWDLFMKDPDVRVGLRRLGFRSPHLKQD